MAIRINRLLGATNHFCVIGLFLFLLIAMAGTIGCSSGGGGDGGGKSEYHLKGYDGATAGAVGNDSLDFYGQFPWYVNLTFQVLDKDFWGVSGLTADDFKVMEDGSEVSKTDSEMNIRTRTKLPPGYTYTLKTILLLDNTPSNPIPLEKMIEAAQVVVDFIDENKQQQIAIVAYDNAGDPVVLQDFTDDLTDLNTTLVNLEPSFGISNLYGAVRYALALFDDNQTPAQPDFVQGFVVAVTDGLDTSSLYDVDDAIALRKNKQVITVAVGPDMREATLNDLERLGNGGFYPVPKPDQPADEGGSKNPASENLCEWMKVVQERMIAYADAFYWLQYRSDATSKDAVKTHAVTLTLNGNRNDGADSRIAGTYSSENFFSGDTSIYFNATGADPDGITEKTIMLERGQGAGEVAETIVALTFSQSGASPSQYEWTSGDTSIVTVKANDSDSSKAVVTVVGPGDVTITVTDTVNNVTQTLSVKVKVREESFEMIRHVVTSRAPWFADATFQVRKTPTTDNKWEWVPDLAREDMTVMENGLKIDMEDSETHLRKRDNIPSTYTYTLKTVLHIDNSPSTRAQNNLNLIKQAAKAFAKRALINDSLDRTDLGPLLDENDETYQQEIAVVSYDEDGETILVQDFTTDLDTVNAAIDNIVRGFGPIDFYGGMLDSLNLWDNDHNPYDAGNAFVQGVVVVLSDGWQSNPGFYDRQAVLDETGTKQIICVSVGDDLVSGNSDDLVAFGNAGFYSVPNPGQTTEVKVVSDDGKVTNKVFYTDLEQTLMGIQHVVYAYANSFYWLNYKSMLAPAPTCDRGESMAITINNNSNTAAGKNVSGNFESCNYFEGIDGMIYVNSSVTDPDGITGDIDMQYVMLGTIPLTDPVFALEAFTYNHENTPAYEWLVSNQNIVRVTPDPRSYANSRAVLSLPPVKSPGTASLRIDDTGNSVWKNIYINVSKLQLPAPIAYYPFNGNTDDETGNGYDGQTFGSTLTRDRFGNPDGAYSFDGKDDYIAIQDLYYGTDAGALTDVVEELTICAWINTATVLTPGTPLYRSRRIISFDASEYWALFLSPEGKLGFWSGYAPVGDGTGTELLSESAYNDGAWHFICGTYSVSGDMKALYVDGILVAQENLDSIGPLGSGATRYGFIGAGSEAEEYNGTRNGSSYFPGLIDNVLIFDTALTPDEIQYLVEN